MEKEFIPYEQALALKELGFDEPCFAYFYHHQEYKIIFDNPTLSRDYNSIKVDVGSIFDHDKERVEKGLETLGDSVSRMTSIPSFYQAFRWFREKHNLKISFSFWNGYNGLIPEPRPYKYECYIIPENGSSIEVSGEKDNFYFNTYEEAELECLKKLIEIVKSKNK